MPPSRLKIESNECRPTPVVVSVEDLRRASRRALVIRSDEVAPLRAVRIASSDLIAPTVVLSPADGSELTQRRITISGLAHRGSRMELRVGEHHAEVPASDATGSFAFSDIPLVEGLNLIEVWNRSHPGDAGEPVRVRVQYERPQVTFATEVDPHTRRPLRRSHVSEIVRCVVCGTFQLFMSWNQEGSCTKPDCTSRQMFRHDEDDFVTDSY